MNIALISNQGITETEKWGGINSHAKMISKLLVQHGHHVTFFTAQGADEIVKEKTDGLGFKYLDSNMNNQTETWRKRLSNAFLSLHRNGFFDCVFAEGASAWGLHKTFRELNLPVFAFVHNFGIVHFYNIWKEVDNIRSMVYFFAKTIPKIIHRMLFYDIPFLQNATYVISGSKFNANLLRTCYRIQKSKLKTVHNWVDTRKFKPTTSPKNKTKAKHGIQENDLVFLLVGSLWRPKGFHVAIKSFRRFLDFCPNARLIIVGRGSYEPRLRSLSYENNYLKEKIAFLGPLPNSQLPSIYNTADVFLNPSLISEVLPFVLIEAMSSGLPIVSTNLSGSTEAIGNAGVLVPPGNIKSFTDAMLFLAKHPEKRETFSIMARKRAVKFFSETVAEKKILSLLDELDETFCMNPNCLGT
jgi:glycosyltransferase involved in cell wall biosynthesis